MYFTWSNINFSVPLKSEDKLALQNSNSMGDDEPELTKEQMKQLSPIDLKLAVLKKQSNVKVNVDPQNGNLKRILIN